MIYLILLPLFFLVMIWYFRVAHRLQIIDNPNTRSSHEQTTIRGAGIIFLVAATVACIMHSSYWLPLFGLFAIGIISFIDDQITVSQRIRIAFHLLAATTLFFSFNLFEVYQWWACILLYVVIIGIINAYNFMDGINGITGAYSLVLLGSLQYVNIFQVEFIDPDLIWLPEMACLVFLYFNFRKNAKCFAGDVGSITLAFWIIWLLLALMLKTGNYIYILFLAVYGVDSVLTIIHRLIRKENIFLAHRLHFYQILANDQKMPHLLVTTAYAVIQLLIIGLVIFTSLNWMLLAAISLLPLIAIYVSLKPRLMVAAKK